ncbi:uncharacterized protein CXQ87_001198 [Candidozyma duobushaemuli]|uniref:Uncharacterized protein n=1 Tax=Candidozyma duobushaemuli TaxID=1231522 RepID=A0A2V1AK79_9ASCO|nr:uncharacterized protein CXQ87_001198 [[Candida] duobushaemulonis]PVH18278.1 hypothetical protein CXQ87_001198 [[Candida] duobushaemulonis]
MNTIYHIGENTCNDFVALEIEKDPSNYVSHDSYTSWVKGKQWKATILRLRELPKAETDSLSAIKNAREIEGVQDFGQGPNMKDGKVRLLSSVIKPNQLLMMPNPSWTRTHVWEMQCFQSMDDRVPLAFGVTHKVENREYEFNNDGAVYLKMIASYRTSLFSASGLLNVLKGFGIQENTRTSTLRDKEYNSAFNLSNFKPQGTVFVADFTNAMYDCNLPNIGPTFHSETCSRTYALEIKITCECHSENSCRSEFSTLIDIDVAINDSKSGIQPQDQVQQRQDVLSLEKVNLSPFIMTDVESIMAKRLQQVHSNSFGYHVSATAMGDSVMVISSVFLPDAFLKRKKSFLDWCSGSEKESSGLSLAPSKGAWIVEEASSGNTGKENFHLSRFATVFEVPWFTEYYKSNDPSFNFSYCKIKGRQASPGKLLYELITLKLHQSTSLNECIYIKRIRVELLQRTTTKSAKGYQSFVSGKEK